ncbi:MAG: glycosyltransferase [Thermoplasmata archaeon]|nr:glycosyltransferase [Thermoplasmata archaeon]
MQRKICIIHDFFFSAGGGEKLVLTLAKALGADVYTTHVERRVLENLGYENVPVYSIGDVPANQFLAAEISTLWYSTLHLKDKYDVYILSGNWAHCAALHHHPNIFYCHTPVRYFYDSRERFLGNFGPLMRSFLKTIIWLQSRYDRYTVRHVDQIVANSRNVQQRIRRYYGRESVLVHPPVDTDRYRFERVGEYWLSVNRITPDKRIELQCEIFRKLRNERLIVAGKIERQAGEYFQSLKPPENIEFLGECSETELMKLYANCKGLITTAIDEDFGMTPLEAMASGKVVLAVNEGGYRETVVDGVTGWLLPPTPDAFVRKVREVDEKTLLGMKDSCIAHARKFDVKVFVGKMEELIEKLC